MAATRELSSETTEREVLRWRFEELLRAGYPEPAALELSRRADVDLHVACELLERSCPPELAVRILV